jgi:PST family polysaccharide transporter
MAVAPLVALFFQEPLVTPILRWLSLTFVIEALSSVHLVRLKRELAFQRKLIPDLGRSVLKGLVSISLALAGFGVWSLVIGQLIGVATAAVLAWIVLPWRPRLTINFGLTRQMLKYGFSIMGMDTLAVLENNLDYLLVGRIFGNATLGIYTLAYRLPELLGVNTLWVMAGALFPAYASVQHQAHLLRQGFLTALRYTAMFSVPIALGMLLAADPLVRVAFGEQWLAAIPVLRVLALFVLVMSIGFNAGDIYKAIDRTDILIKMGLLRVTLMLPVLWAGTYFGLVGVAIGHLIIGLAYNTLNLWVATRVVKVSWSDILLQLKPSFLSGLALILLAGPVVYLTNDILPPVRLVMIILAGAVGYLSILWLLERESLLRVGRLIGWPGWSRKGPASPLALTSSDVDAG